MYARSLLHELKQRDDVSPISITGPRSGGPVAMAKWLLAGAHREVLRRRADLLHCPAFVAPWRSPVPLVITIHDAASVRFPQDYPLEWRLYDKFFLPRLARRAACVITVSEYARQDAIRYYKAPRSRTFVTYEAPGRQYVPQPFESVDRLRAEYGLPTRTDSRGDARPLLLFSGAPIGRKNLDLVLRIMWSAPTDSALSRAMLAISGAEESAYPAYRNLIRSHGLEGRVAWLGRVSSEKMPALYASADALVYPSLYEGFGLPPLEAMAVGTPVVASNASCLPEVLGEGALLVDPQDEAGFAAAVERVLTQPGLQSSLVEAGRAQAARYSWARCAEQTCGVYRQAARTCA